MKFLKREVYIIPNDYMITKKSEPCEDASMGKFRCKNKHQCWEPCGELGKKKKDISLLCCSDCATLNAMQPCEACSNNIAQKL